MEGPCLQGEGKGRESGKGKPGCSLFHASTPSSVFLFPPGKASRGERREKKETGLEREREKSFGFSGGGERNEE